MSTQQPTLPGLPAPPPPQFCARHPQKRAIGYTVRKLEGIQRAIVIPLCWVCCDSPYHGFKTVAHVLSSVAPTHPDTLRLLSLFDSERSVF